MAWLHNYRVTVSGSFIVEAGDEDTAWEKANEILAYGDVALGVGVALGVDDIQREDEDPYEN